MELLQQIANGDEIAFRSIYELYWDKIYSSALSYLKSPLAAQDAVQEVFLKLWINRKQLPAVKNFGGYLTIITRNLIIDGLRRKLPLHSSTVEDDAEEKEAIPDQQLEAKEMATHIRKAVSLLTPSQQQVYNLSREKGLPLKEVAAHLNISYNTAREHMSQALKGIRKYLKEHLGNLYLLALLFINF